MSDLLVTGGNGFIGSKLMERLGNRAESFDAVSGQDLRNQSQVFESVKGKESVFHLAAIADLNWARLHPVETMRINIEGTWNVAMACKKYGAKLYYASTCCVYGNQEVHPVTEKTLPNPAEIYACTKLAGENVIRGFHLTYGLQYNNMRFATIYGEGTRPALATHIFLRQALQGEPITVHGDGGQTRTLTYIDDLVDAIISLYRSGKMNDNWNFTATEEISALQMAQDIKRITRSKSPIVFIPQRIGQTVKEQISADKMKDEVGWKSRITWEDGLERMLEWFLATNQVVNTYREDDPRGFKVSRTEPEKV